MDQNTSLLARHEFLIRRLFSLCGIVPVGAYMCIHLITNASMLNGAATFQGNVYQIHSLGPLLPIVEWVFIFLPILFHAVIGVIIVRSGLPNTSAYPYASNARYTLQRATGMIAFLFIVWHVFHMHGWFHTEWWLRHVAEPMSGAMFKPYNAASTAARALQMSPIVAVLYGIGVLACVYHLSNGIWTAGITWGIWTTPTSMKRASAACAVFGVVLAVVSAGALVAPLTLDADEAQRIENEMYDAKLSAHEVQENEHKRSRQEGSEVSDAETPKED